MDNKNQPPSEDEEIALAQFIGNLPAEKRETILESLSILAMSIQSAPESAASKKMTAEHLTQYLTDSGVNMRLNHKGKARTQWLLFVLSCLLVGFFVFVICTFQSSPDMIEKIIYTSGGAILGGIGGFGYGKTKHND